MDRQKLRVDRRVLQLDKRVLRVGKPEPQAAEEYYN